MGNARARQETALVLGQPHDEEPLHHVDCEEGMPTWSLEAALAVLAIAGHPTLRTIEIEERCAHEGVAIGDPALLFASLPRLESISNGATIVRRREIGSQIEIIDSRRVPASGRFRAIGHEPRSVAHVFSVCRCSITRDSLCFETSGK